MEFNVTIEGLDGLRASFARAPGLVTPVLSAALNGSQAILAQFSRFPYVPQKTGRLIQSFTGQTLGLVLHWKPTASYAMMVEMGTRPHQIFPVNKKALFWPGADHPVAYVNHPGTKPNPFMERIVEAASPGINSLFQQAMQKVALQISSSGA